MARKVRWLVLQVLAVFLLMATGLFTIYSCFTLGPWLETKYWPPVGKMEIVSSDNLETGETVIYARFTKYRSECEYLGISWFKGARTGEFSRIPVTLLRRTGDISSPNRPEGTQTAGPWIIPLSLDEIKHNSFVELQHRCHGFWLTTTEFWP